MTIATIAAAGAVALTTLCAATLALPRHVGIERSTIVGAAPEAVLALAASSSGFQSFNPYKTLDPDLRIAPFGPAEGVGAGFRFDGRDGHGTQTVASVTDESVTYRIDLGTFGQPVQTIRAVPVEGGGTEITWRIDSDTGFNPMLRAFGPFMDRLMGSTVELGLENLAKASA
jgi:hypothetical protein